jgi:hypothetical protein
MKKSILQMGNALTKVEQKKVQGGGDPWPIFDDGCSSNIACYPGAILNRGGQCPTGETCVVFDFGAICQCS